jgi:hypothetical protein
MKKALFLLNIFVAGHAFAQCHSFAAAIIGAQGGNCLGTALKVKSTHAFSKITWYQGNTVVATVDAWRRWGCCTDRRHHRRRHSTRLTHRRLGRLHRERLCLQRRQSRHLEMASRRQRLVCRRNGPAGVDARSNARPSVHGHPYRYPW